ncbi:uncharacterized protein LOC142582760 isoform X2 [Dermacentor variabilis]|uniref:uncharacterized protein LOC142582760 isoform X2 n=1 Tax=Dermacentor variabilis TaxID=34621 RepID=UPI003F5B67B5
MCQQGRDDALKWRLLVAATSQLASAVGVASRHVSIRVDAGSKLSNIAGACGLLVEEQLVEFLERVLCVDLELRSARRGSARCDLTHCDSSH